MRKSMQGVTLIELMVVVVIVSILAAVAYPSYRDHVTRAKRTEAKAALLQIATNQERHYLNHNVYADKLGPLGISSATTDSGSYTISINNAGANTYTAVATYVGGDAAEAGRCATFTVDATGAKTSSPRDDCWTSSR